MQRALATLAALITFAGAPRPARAHDYWLVPGLFHVGKAPRTIPVTTFVGDGFVAEEEKPYAAARTERLDLVDREGRVSLLGSATDGARTFDVAVRGDGGHLVVMHRNAARIELTPEKFESYLKEEGLGAIVAERAKHGESALPGRERYVRFLKTLVQAGEKNDDVYATESKETLSLVPRKNPAFVKPGGTLEVRVAYAGAPLAGATLEAFSRDGADIAGKTYRTDADGIAHVTIDRSATWILRTVHMIRCEGCADADWSSAWASYTFASVPDGGGDVIAPSMFLVGEKGVPAEQVEPNRSPLPTLPPPQKGCTCRVGDQGQDARSGLFAIAAVIAWGARRARRRAPT